MNRENAGELLKARPGAEISPRRFPPPPAEEFWERGFTLVPRVTTDEEINWLRKVYDLLFSSDLELPKGARHWDATRRSPARPGARRQPGPVSEIALSGAARDAFLPQHAAHRAKASGQRRVELLGSYAAQGAGLHGSDSVASGRGLLGSPFRPRRCCLLDAAGRRHRGRRRNGLCSRIPQDVLDAPWFRGHR